MSGDDKNSGDKTEKPTPKRIKDARKKGDVSKSKDLTTTIELVIWLMLFWLAAGYAGNHMSHLFDTAFGRINQPGPISVVEVGQTAIVTLAYILAPLLLGVAVIGALVDFFQVGPIFAPTKLKPDVSRMNPAQGLKRIFSMDNLFEIVKSVLKTALIIAITYFLVMHIVPALVKLPLGTLGDTTAIYHKAILWLMMIVIGVFLFVAFGDAGYQRYSYIKKLMMSRRDIRQEMKDDEGDPYIKSKRKQLHQEWATRNTLESVKQSSVLVVNPTHVGIAIEYEPGETPVPIVAAKGEDYLVPLMKQAAIEANVPIMRHVPLARKLNESTDIDDFVPLEVFDAVAEVLHWAAAVRRGDLPPESGVNERAVNEDGLSMH